MEVLQFNSLSPEGQRACSHTARHCQARAETLCSQRAQNLEKLTVSRYTELGLSLKYLV